VPDPSRYSPIADYAVIGDCRSAALISKSGSIDWLCWPRFDSASVFAALLDAGLGGRFRVAPSSVTGVARRYVGDTNVLETTFETPTGTLRLTDVMPVADERVKSRELWPEHEILRRVEVVSGEVEVFVHYEPRLDYARARARSVRRPHNAFQVEFGAAVLTLRSEIPLRLSPEEDSVSGRAVMKAGSRAFVSLSFTYGTPAVLPALGDRAQELVDGSVRWWRDWASQCNYDWEYRDAVIRSALTLKLLTYAPSGAIVAAVTTSLPEHVGGARNWDYRYCWLRDAALTLRALVDLGFSVEAESFLSWTLHATRLTQPRLQILYDVYGGSHLPERALDHLEGYATSRPVRVGNDAAGQLQLDVYGEVIEAAHQFVARGGALDRQTAATLAKLGRTVCDIWTLPDEGIWEPRNGRRHHTHSKLLCWVAMDRLVKLEAEGHIDARGRRFAEVRDRIRTVIERDGWNDRIGSYAAVFGTDEVDASLLRLALCGYADPTSARIVSTTARIREQLAAGDGLLYRYLGEDGLPGVEGAFGICSFWGVEACALAGRHGEARRLFETIVACANDVGLLSEEIDPATGALLGNFPQAFTHVGLIDAALTLAEQAGCSPTQKAASLTKGRRV
jgi:GH15 family glucan-1,4-alpha-glucosidase